MQSFVRDSKALEKGLFKIVDARQGVQTMLNINYLPDLLKHIKSSLTPDEILRLQEYHLQNYIVELSIAYSGDSSLEALEHHILSHIRGNNNFWYRHNNQQVIEEEQELKHTAIQTYHQDIKQLKQAFKEEQCMETYEIQYPQRTSNKFSFNVLHQANEPHLGTRCCINHLAFMPKFLIEKDDKQSNKNEKKVTQNHRKQLNKMLEQCILFILSNKKSFSQPASTPQKAVSSSSDKPEQSVDEQEEEEPEFKDKNCQENKTFQDQFMDFIETIPTVPTFHNSPHMKNLTKNIMTVCMNLLNRDIMEEKDVQKPIIKSHQKFDSLQVLEIDENAVEVLSKISDYQLDEEQIQLLTIIFLRQWNSKLKTITEDIDMIRRDKKRGWISSPETIEAVKSSYMEMLNRPDFVELTQYRASGSAIPWKDDDYLRFLKGLAEYFNVPTNNKKIASFMGSKIQPNHVKHVKGIYLTVMKDRMDRGECGGGKRGKCLSKAEFLQRDISTFSMRWFEKSKKIKKRKQKRRRRMSQSDINDEIDSDF